MEVLQNQVLIAVLAAWFLAQLFKPFVYYWQHREWDWSLWFSAGGMPSSHSAIMVAATAATGMVAGFSSPAFALGVAISMIVLYDAAGIRRQAGEHARIINAIIDDLSHGHPLKEEYLNELLGHTPRQVIGGIFLGLVVAYAVVMLMG